MTPQTFEHYVIGLLLALAISAAAYRVRALTLTGAFAATVVGTLIYGLGGLPCAGALLTFFITSSALSRWRKAVKDTLRFEKPGARDAGQVLANGVSRQPASCCHGSCPT